MSSGGALSKVRNFVARCTQNHTGHDHDAVSQWAISEASPLLGRVAQMNGATLQIVHCVRVPQGICLYGVVDPRHLQKVLGLAAQFGLVLGTVNEPRLRRDGSFIAIEITLPGHRYYVPADSIPRREGMYLPLGVGMNAQPVYLNMRSPAYAHALIAGATGSGKTALLRSIIFSLARQNDYRSLAMIVVDGKNGYDYNALRGLAHLLEPVIVEPRRAILATYWVLQEIERRKSMRGEDVRNEPSIIMIIDEVHEVLIQGGQELVQAISRITELGRTFKTHMILATQRPTRESLGSMLAAANLGVRIVGKVNSAEQAAIATGRAQTDAHKLAGQGDMLAVFSEQVLRLQASFVDDSFLVGLQHNGKRQLDLSAVESFLPSGKIGESSSLPGRPKDEFSPPEIAYAFTHPDIGIRALQSQLSIGSGKATRLRDELARPLRAEVERLGFDVVERQVKGKEKEA